MIAGEDIKVGAVVRHLGDPNSWGDTDAEHFKLFTIVEDIGSLEKYFTENLVRRIAVAANKEIFELGTEFSLQALEPSDNIARPILAERKVGKVPMHMVVDGFPSALREVAKVMDWAAKVKGYKLHDWRNLPDADVEFPSAGYRHMFDNSEMKAQGLPALERVDHESHLVHLAHECFNKLAELELVMTGKIK